MRIHEPSSDRRTSYAIRVVTLAAVLVVAGCGQDGATSEGSTTVASASYPLTVIADNGEVTLGQRPAAVVSLSPSLTEMLFAVGAGDQVVAVDSSSNFPEEAPVTELSGFRPNVEAIGSYNPDLVFVSRDRDGIVATLEEVGIPVVVLESAGDLEDVYRQIGVVGELTGNGEAAESLTSQMKESIGGMIASAGSNVEDLTYFYELSSDYHSMTSDTFVGSVLTQLGLENIADGVDEEALLSRDQRRHEIRRVADTRRRHNRRPVRGAADASAPARR